jgi:hypothetical protein
MEDLKMTESKFTPGPWHIGFESAHSCDRYAKNAEWARIRDINNDLIAKIESVHPKGERQSIDFDIESGNARLIAAAPDGIRFAEIVLNNLDYTPSRADVAEIRRHAESFLKKALGD